MNLKECVRKYLNIEPMTYKEAVKAGGKCFEEYNASDSKNTMALSMIFKPKIEESGLKQSYEVELDATLLAVEMNLRGILVDSSAISTRLENNFRQKVLLKKEIDPEGKLNLRSSLQLRRFLYDEKQIPIKNHEGQISTSLKTLRSIANVHDCDELRKLILFKELEAEDKCLEAIRKYCDNSSSVIYPFLNPSGTETGRFSSSHPNLQNINSDTFFRSLFISRPNRDFICLDQSRIEPTVLSAIVKQGPFQELFGDNIDCYEKISEIMTAQLGFKISRSSAKVLLLAVMYGMGPNSVAELLGVELAKGEHILKTFFVTFPEIKLLEKELIDFAKENGYVKTMLGRRRFIANINSFDKKLASRARRQVLNSVIQGTAAELFKTQLMRLRKALPMSCHFLLSVHDEVLIECPEEQSKKILNISIEVMQTAPTWFSHRLWVKGGVGKSWAEAKPK